jgi:hypothetical protein
MSLDKNMIVMNGGEEDSYQFMILQKVRENSPVEDLADAVSNFADTMLETEHDDWDVFFAAQQRAGMYSADGEIFRDLGAVMQGVSDYAKSDTVFQFAYDAKEAFDQCIIANHGSSQDNGLSIYLPRWWWDDMEIEGYEYNFEFPNDDGDYIQHWDQFLWEYLEGEYNYPIALIQDSELTGAATFSKSISGGTSVSNYMMISYPLWSDSDDPLLDNLGAYDTELWRAFMWDPETESYDEYPFEYSYGKVEVANSHSFMSYTESGYIEPGMGLWLISRNNATLTIAGEMDDYYDEPYPIPLYPGWNQVSGAFNFDIDWDTVDVTDYETTMCNVLSEDNTFCSHTLWRYSGGSYNGATVAGVMRRGESYWLKNLTDEVVYLVINPVRSSMENDFVPSLEQSLTMFAKASGEATPPPPPGGMGIESEDDGGGSGGGSGCFIATASFGSPMAGEVGILRNFRDEYLITNPIGQLFVSTYYKYSPKIADFIAENTFLKIFVRTTLYPIVKGCGVFDDVSQKADGAL